jgi:predicted RNase H-like nuclease (RuvC/YqgF family)
LSLHHTVLQDELEVKDSELEAVKSEREKLEHEMATLLQQVQKEDSKARGKGPGGMLHSALQQLQRELRREAMANEKLMVKAESLLKADKPDSGDTGSGSKLQDDTNNLQGSDDENDPTDESHVSNGTGGCASFMPCRCVLACQQMVPLC